MSLLLSVASVPGAPNSRRQPGAYTLLVCRWVFLIRDGQASLNWCGGAARGGYYFGQHPDADAAERTRFLLLPLSV